MKKLFVFHVLVFIFNFSVFSQWSQEFRLTEDNGNSFTAANQTKAEKNLAVSGDTLHLVWFDEKDYDPQSYTIFYKRSTDNGNTWGNELQLSDLGSGLQCFAYNPCIAVTGSKIHVVWYEMNTFLVNRLLYRCSLDGGESWEPVVMLSDSVGLGMDGTMEMIPVGQTLNLFFSGTVQNLSDEEIYFMQSSDEGTTWGNKIRLSDQTESANYPTAVIQGSNMFLAYSTHPYAGDSFLWFISSSDGGLTWSAPVQLENDPALSLAPKMCATSSGKLHLVWMDRKTDWHIWYIYSSDGGQNWSNPEKLSSIVWSYYPYLIAASDQQLYLTYYSLEGKYKIHLLNSTDDGQTWSPDTILVAQNEVAAFPTLGFSSDRLHMVWEDGRNGTDNLEIYYRYYSCSPVGIFEENSSLQGEIHLVQNLPNPFTSSTVINFSIPDDQNVKVIIYNLTGQKVKELLNQPLNSGNHSLRWDARDENGNAVAPGIYNYTLETSSAKVTKKMILVR